MVVGKSGSEGLKDRLSGRVIHGTNIGPKPYLTQEEEKQLVEFLVNCYKMGYGKTRGEVLKIVEAIMLKKGRKHEGRISQGWWCRFRDRWPSPCSNPSPASSSLSSPAVSTPQAPPNSYLLDTGSCKYIQFVVYYVWCFVYV